MDQPIFWYSRSIFEVSDLEESINFYTRKLNFEEQWRQGDSIAQVNRNGVEIILHDNKLKPIGGGKVLIILNLSLLHELHDEFQNERIECSFMSVPWIALIVKDPDGNELWFQDTSSLG